MFGSVMLRESPASSKWERHSHATEAFFEHLFTVPISCDLSVLHLCEVKHVRSYLGQVGVPQPNQDNIVVLGELIKSPAHCLLLECTPPLSLSTILHSPDA